MKELVFDWLFPFGGTGGGALGFLEEEIRLLGHVGRIRSLGSIDFDAIANRTFTRFTGSPAHTIDISRLTGARLIELYGVRAPWGVFLSPPCKGASRLLSQKKSETPKYREMNRLAVAWMRAMLEAWGDDPPALVLLENVPGLPTRAPEMLGELESMLRRAGYVLSHRTHDCGEIGGLAQHRKRFLLVARLPRKCASLLREPPAKRVRGVGEVLAELPMPATLAAARWGALHVMPRLSWRNWLRLALIPAGGDWRDLAGVLEGRARREVFRRHAVQRWDDAHPAVTGPGGHSVEAVADPRVSMPARSWGGGDLGVTGWSDASSTVAGESLPRNGRFSVADPRVLDAVPVRVGYDAAYGVLGWTDAARTIAGNTAAGCGAYAVAEPRDRSSLVDARVLTLDEAMALDLDPKKAPVFVPVIVAEDGTWHRPMTLLELARLQGYPAVMHGEPLRFDGTRTQIAEHIGNSVPVGAARAMARQMLLTSMYSVLDPFRVTSGATWVDGPEIGAVQ